MALSTTDLGSGSGGSSMSKTITPGNHRLKINSIELEEFRFIPGAYHLILNVETEPIDDFEGFLLDKDDPSAGNYAGQIGKVKASQYAYADGETKSGIKVNRDRSIMIFLQSLSKTLGINEWFLSQDNKHESIEDFVKAFNNEAPYKDKFLEFCVAGKEYLNKNGYTNYDMWLPKAENRKYSFGEVDSNNILEYNEEKHLKKLEVKETKSFGDDDDFSMPSGTSSDFSLD